ncbi:MAG TPA: NUDIX domain-containing protein [Candidatus Binatus sp.]|nr:NUDIX domain-containing protein [Candidatus Binatus sp.]
MTQALDTSSKLLRLPEESKLRRGDFSTASSTILKYASTPAWEDLSLDSDDCSRHTLVSHVVLLHHNSALLVKYREMPDGQKGWFLPNDDLKHVEHPEEGAKRILREQVGIEPSTLKLAQIESFVGNDKSWHLIFDFLAFPLSMKITKAPSLLDAQWFEIEKLPPVSEFAHHGWGHSALLKFAKVQF